MPTIYSLISIDKECTNCQYVNAISYSKELLENMIQNIHPDLLKAANFLIKPNTYIYRLIYFHGKILLTKPYFDYNIIFNTNNLYAFNKITTSGVENVLLDTTGYNVEDLRRLSIFKNDLSYNIIQFDVFYDEGIMNA